MSIARLGSCLSTPFQGCKGEEGSLPARVAKNWRTVPAVAVTAILVVALVSSLVWGATGLSVTYGVGLGLSGYLLYLAYRYRHLQSLEKSAEKLETGVEGLGTVSENLATNTGNLKTLLTEFKDTLKTIGEQCGEELGAFKTLAAMVSKALDSVDVEGQKDVLEEQRKNILNQERENGKLQGEREALAEQVGVLRDLATDFKTQIGNLTTATKEVKKLDDIAKRLEAFATAASEVLEREPSDQFSKKGLKA